MITFLVRRLEQQVCVDTSNVLIQMLMRMSIIAHRLVSHPVQVKPEHPTWAL